MTTLRWLFIIPAAVLAAALVAFPIHWLVMINLGGWSREPIIEIRDQGTLKSIELFLQGLFGPFAFVYAGARTAPSRRFPVALVLAVIVVVGALLLANWINSWGTGIEVRHGLLQTISQVVGCLGAVLLIRARETRRDGPAPNSAAKPESLEVLQRNLEEAKHDLQLLENPETIFAFGQAAYEGDGIPQNYLEAAGWFRIAAERGHLKAAHNLGLMCEQGEGLPEDAAEAAKWYRTAAEQGHAGSQNNLGVLFENGEGVSQSAAEALGWYRKAAANGDPNGIDNAARLGGQMKRDECTKLVNDFVDSISTDGPPLIGDIATLPHPKPKIMYAIRWLMDHYQAGLESATDDELCSKYRSLLPTFGDLFTRLARDWHEIADEDREAVARLRSCETFPDWALPLKAKYINEDRAREEACDVAIRVIADRAR